MVTKTEFPKKPARKKIRSSFEDKIISFVCYSFVSLFAIAVMYPMLNLISVSVSTYRAYLLRPWMFFPTEFDFTAFTTVFQSPQLMQSYGNTLFITGVGTVLTLAVTALTAYPISRPQLRYKSMYMTLIIITMMIGAGTIPNFLLIRDLGMYNTIWALFIPSTVGAYNVILMINFFRGLPDSLLEAAKVDGATETRILFSIVLPLSLPIMATIGLFRAVGLWNSYFAGIVYIRDRELWPVQLVLREVILAANTAMAESGGNAAEMDLSNIPTISIQYASLLVVMVPIMCVYPFLQKYFAKGIMLGAVKG